MTTFSSQPPSPRKCRIHPVYPAILGVSALLLLGGCKRSEATQSPEHVAAAGGADPIFDAGPSTDSDAAPPVSAGGAAPSPNAGGGKVAPFDQAKDPADSGAVRDAGRKPPPPPPPQPPGGMPAPHVTAPAAPPATIAK